MTAVFKEEPPEMSDPVRPLPAALERTCDVVWRRARNSASSRREIFLLRSVHFQEPRPAGRACHGWPRRVPPRYGLASAWYSRQFRQGTWSMARRPVATTRMEFAIPVPEE